MVTLQKIENLVLFLTLFFLPTQLGKHYWPSFSYVYSLQIDYLSPTIYFWDLLVVCLIAVFILRGEKVNKSALNIYFIFLLSQVVSLLYFLHQGANLGAGLVRVEQYLMAGLFGVYLASRNISNLRAVFIWGLSGAILSQSILAIAQFLRGGTLGLWVIGERAFSLSTPAIAKFDFYGRQFLRPYATFPHPNVLAAFMVVAGNLLFWFNKKEKITSLWAALTILLTVSRTAMVAGFISAMFLMGKNRKFLLLAVVILLPILYIRFFSIFNFDNVSLLRREQLSEVAIAIFNEHPLTGVGLNNFIPISSNEVLVGPSRFLQPVHNIFLLSLAETGVVGLAGLLILISWPMWILARERNWTLFLTWGVIIFLGMFDHYFLTLPQGYRMLFLIWGISLSRVK